MSLQVPKREVIVSRVAIAARSLAAVESGAVGIACLCLALAAGVLAGADLAAVGTWQAAGLCALLAGGTWQQEHRRATASVARDIDEGLGEGGALFTAWELEGRGAEDSLCSLLGREVAARRSARGMLAAILPASLPIMALPFLAAGLLFLALEEVRGEPGGPADWQRLTLRLEEDLEGFLGAEPGATLEGSEAFLEEQLAELADLARTAAQLATEPQGEGQGIEELRDLQQRLSALEALAPGDSALLDQLQEAARTLDSALMALESEALVHAGPEPKGGAMGSPGASQGREVPAAGAGGTMGGSQPPPRTGSLSPGADGRSAGVLSGPAWPAAYDGIVARWVETPRLAGTRR